ncbi:MAG: S9 family peptidase, partial [Mycobacterium leprae]
AARVSLPTWARQAPHRCVFVGNASGTWEVYAWDRTTGRTRRVTERPHGTASGAVDPSGRHVWWFADTDGDEFGVWMRQLFDGGPDEEAVPGLRPAYPGGLALGDHGLVAVGGSTEDETSIHLARPDEPPAVLYRHREDASVVDVSADETLVAIEHSEHGDSRHPALRVLRPDATVAGELWDGPGLGLSGVGFAPAAGDTRLLALHERHGRPEPLLWDVASGVVTEVDTGLPGEVGASWFPDARALLVTHDHEARTQLYRYDLASRTLTRLDTPPGVVTAATARPDGTVEYAWSSAAAPPQVRSTAGGTLLRPPGEPAPASVPVEDAWVDGPGGRIHALVSRPDGAAPAGSAHRAHPTVFLVHGGPTHHDADAFAADVAAWVDTGFAVVRVNYRGSTGYGRRWRDAIEHRVGLTELEDLIAVRDWAVTSGLADPARLALTGASWGGYLTLLGLGVAPDRWTLGIAAVPVADYVAAYEDEMEPLRAFDRSLFGGSPGEVPERYSAASPITYVDRVRAPLLVLAGENDPRCPIRQIENYLARLRERGTPHEVYRYDAGHGSLVVEERIRQMAAELDFARRHLAATLS